MPRPKGSKNKVKRSNATELSAQLEAMTKEYESLVAEKTALETSISESMGKLKDARRAVRKMETQLTKLQAKKAEADAVAASAEAKKAIDEKIDTLIKEGKDTSAILEVLSNL